VLCLVENKRIVIVGIPGVGKTTLVTTVVDKLNDENKHASVKSYGTVMFEQAKKIGVDNRDELRKLPVEKQKELQKMAAEEISNLKDNVVFIDTHAFIASKSGFYPGLPNHVLQILQPTHFIIISAHPAEILNRRMKDETRNRDKISIGGIKNELAIQESMLSSCSVLTGSPIKVILNNEGKVEEAANKVIKTIGV